MPSHQRPASLLPRYHMGRHRVGDIRFQENLLTSGLAPLQQPRQSFNNQGYMPNGASAGLGQAAPGATPLLPNQGRVVQTGPIRVLCIADVRGTISLALCFVMLRC